MTRIALLAFLMIGQAAQINNLMPMQPSAKPVVVPVLPQNQRHEEVKPCSKDDRDGACNYNNFPDIVSTQLILDPVQAKYPGNEWVKRCSATNHDSACFDPKMPHIVSHLYVVSKEACERHERVECEELPSCSFSKGEKFDFRKCRTWIPVGKPVFEAETPESPLEPDKQRMGVAALVHVPKLKFTPVELPLSGVWITNGEEWKSFIIISDPVVGSSMTKDDVNVYTITATKDWHCQVTSSTVNRDQVTTIAQLTCVKADGAKR